MVSSIHPTAIIEKSVKIGKNVRIGPYCVLTEQVELDDGVELISHVTLAGRTKIGKETKIYPFSSIGHPTQDLKYKGEPSTLTIGAHNIIREYVTIQAGTAGGIMKTEVGDHCLLMASTHVAHDCILGNRVIMANNATLAGHVIIEDHVIIGGLSAIHQFVRIGAHAIIGGMSAVEHDVIPYGAVKGERANLYGLNLIGLKRRGAGGVLIKILKPFQETRADRPTIGPQTIIHALEAGLRGIAVEAGGVIVHQLPKIVEIANKNDFFLIGLKIKS